MKTICLIETCNSCVIGKRYCRKHYDHFIRLDYRKKYAKENRGKYKYSGNFLKALERDCYTCQQCGTKERLHVHHLDGKGSTLPSNQRNDKLDNLITVCIVCHPKIHTSLVVKEKYKDKWAWKYDRCVLCKNNNKRHISLGLCSTCYTRERKKRPNYISYQKAYYTSKRLTASY